MQAQVLILLVSLVGCELLAFAGREQSAMAEEKKSDDASIQRQIDALREKGGLVKLEAKTYIVRKAIVLYDNITIEGAGMESTIIRLADGVNLGPAEGRMPFVNRCIIRNENYDELATTEGNHDVTIRNLTMDGNADNNTLCGEGVLLPNCYNYRIENVHVKNCRGFAGVYTNPCHLAARKKIKYKNYILNCIVEGQQAATDRDAPYGHGFYITAWDNDNVLLKGCVARNNKGAGIHGEDFISYFFVEENEAYGNGGSGIWFCEVRNSIIKGNKTHHNAGDGIAISQGKGNRNNLVCENDVHHNGNHGVSLARQYDTGDSFSSILTNRVWNNRAAAIFIADSAGGNTIGFNLCYDDRDADDHKQQYGIIVDSKRNSIINNYVAGNAKDAIKAAEGNTVIEWESNIPLTPEQLVGTYGVRKVFGGRQREEKPGKVLEVKGPDGGQIQERIYALGAEGGVVRLAAGTYNISRAIVLRDKVTIQGEGMDKTTIRLAEAANPPDAAGRIPFVNRCIVRNENYDEQKTPKGNHDITIRDLTIDGNAENNPNCGEGILLATCYNYRVESVRVKNCRGFGGIYTNPSHWARGQKIPYRNYIVNCIVENNRSALDRDAPYGHGIYVTAWDNDNVLIRGNVCRNNAGSGIHLEDGVQHISVESNECYGNRQYGLWMAGASRSIIRNNLLHHNLRGISATHSSKDLFYGNQIYDNALEGIYVGVWGFGEHAADRTKLEGTHHIIAGNIVRNNNQHYMDAGAGIYVDTRFNTLAFNFIYDDQTDKTQFIAIIAYAPDNVAVNNWFGPAAYYRSGNTLVNMAGKNVLVPWESEKPWQLGDLVGGP